MITLSYLQGVETYSVLYCPRLGRIGGGHQANSGPEPTDTGMEAGAVGLCPVLDYIMVGLVLCSKSKAWTLFLHPPTPDPSKKLHSMLWWCLKLGEKFLGSSFLQCIVLFCFLLVY